MGFENSKFTSKKFGVGGFAASNFSGGTSAGSSTGETDEESNDAWLWESGERILWEDGLSLILLES